MSSEAAVSYAALILADAEVEISAEKLLALTKAAKIEVQPVSWKIFHICLVEPVCWIWMKLQIKK